MFTVMKPEEAFVLKEKHAKSISVEFLQPHYTHARINYCFGGSWREREDSSAYGILQHFYRFCMPAGSPVDNSIAEDRFVKWYIYSL